jgi:predicted Zn finger-like uncharacterized protein
MKNACPACGTVYAVTARDIGRRFRCKKCSIALRVDATGVVLDDTTTEPEAAATGPAQAVTRSAWLARLKQFVEVVGGSATLLFACGLFLVLFFYFQGTLKNGSLNRADAGVLEVKHQREVRLRRYHYEQNRLEDDLSAKAITLEDFQKRSSDIARERKRIDREFEPKIDAANDAKTEVAISAGRWAWFDACGLMWGFILLAFGSLAFVRSSSHLVVRVVGGTLLVMLMMTVFVRFAGCQGTAISENLSAGEKRNYYPV